MGNFVVVTAVQASGLEIATGLPVYVLLPLVIVIGIVAVVGIRWIFKKTTQK